jgi:hypothetical protein
MISSGNFIFKQNGKEALAKYFLDSDKRYCSVTLSREELPNQFQLTKHDGQYYLDSEGRLFNEETYSDIMNALICNRHYLI